MRWHATVDKPIPSSNTRTSECFAWLPTTVQSNDQPMVVWLEWYDVHQEWAVPGYGYYTEWVTVSKYLKEPP